MAAEIEGVDLDNDQKEIIKNSLQRSIDSQIYLNTAQAIAAEASARFSNENIKPLKDNYSYGQNRLKIGKGSEKMLKNKLRSRLSNGLKRTCSKGRNLS